MKKIKYITRLLVICTVVAFTSCDDWFDIRPKSETILEDFWNDEKDVLSMVGSCYRSMNEVAFMERLIVWGELRSDNVIAGKNSSDPVRDMLNLNLVSSNEFASWSNFYSTINYCNTVLFYAPDVQKIDPNFTETSLNAYLAEVKAIRALCYFTLIRTFRNIPLVTDPTVDDSQSFEIFQEDPEDILNFITEDLKDAENNAYDTYDNLQYTKGRITKNAIRALLADIYLWRNDYENCILYCDKILNDSRTSLMLETSELYSYNRNVFYSGNSSESIFELQFSINNIRNYAVSEMYDDNGGRNGKNTEQLSAFNFSSQGDLFVSTDLRGKDAFFPGNNNSSHLPIKKYVSYRYSTSNTVNESDYISNSDAPNWIFYRLPDAYLMKAEALVEMGGENNLRDAFDLVLLTYERANPDLGPSPLSFDTYNNQLAMRNLVFDERQREFIFEGKRYFDLLRRINREGSAVQVVSNYLMRKYMSLDQTTVRSKLTDIDALYMPIHRDEINQNPNLVQNPFYDTSSETERN